jgi:ethanolamine utilization protein EutA (predicted chaperonin)
MKKLVVLSILVTSMAFAGKAEREFIKDSLNPAISEAEAAFKKTCGCPLKITHKGLETEDHLRLVRSVANSITEGVSYCTDAESKKAVCQMKSLEVSKSNESAFTFSGGRGIATTDGQSFPPFRMMTEKLDQ